jgi:hypothetical protein
VQRVTDVTKRVTDVTTGPADPEESGFMRGVIWG